MPAESQAQQELAGSDLARLRRGEPTRTGMTETQLKEFASTPRKGLPHYVSKKNQMEALKRH